MGQGLDLLEPHGVGVRHTLKINGSLNLSILGGLQQQIKNGKADSYERARVQMGKPNNS